MEVHSHSLETQGVNKDADKSLNPEFKAPPSSQIPHMENFTVPPPLHSNDVHGKDEAAYNSIDSGASAPPTATFSFPPLPSDLNTTPSNINFQTFESVVVEQSSQYDSAHQVGDQEEAFDDMVILEDGMVTAASLTGGGADAFQDSGMQMEDFQQADIFTAAPVASDVPNDMSAGENPEVPSVTVFTETTITSEVVVQEVTTTEDSLPPSHENGVTAVTTSEGQALDASEEIDAEEVLPSDGAEAKMPEVTDAANTGEEPVLKSGSGAGSQEVSEEDIKAIKGQKVVKKFGRKQYSGEVSDFDPETKWFKVVYEDGDDEDLELWEVKLILESALSSPSSSKKRSRKESGVNRSSNKSSKKARKSGDNSATKKTKNASKSSVKSPKTPGSTAKGSRGAKNSSVPSKGRSPGKLITKALESSAFKTPQVKEGKGKSNLGTSSLRSNKGESSKKRKTVKLSRNLNLQSPKEKEQVGIESSGSKRATKSGRQSASGLKRKAVPGATTVEKSKRARKGASEAEGDVSSLVGRRVEKDFNGVLYSGVVLKHDQKTGYFKVKYEDGDSEDLEKVELDSILVQEAENAEEREDKPAKLSSLSSLISAGKRSGTLRRK